MKSVLLSLASLAFALASPTCPDVPCSTYRDCSGAGFTGTFRCQNSKCVPSQCGFIGAQPCPASQTCLLGVCTTGGPGANCSERWECRENEHCYVNYNPTRTGYCQVVLGTPCTTECLGQFECDAGKCKISVLRSAGESCVSNDTHVPICGLGGSCAGGVCPSKQRTSCSSNCTVNDDCLSGLCYQGQCSESSRGLGSACVIDAQCATSNCSSSKCAGSCDWSKSCPEGSYCRDGTCILQNNGCGDGYFMNGNCVPYGKFNESCPCSWKYTCVNNVCVDWPGPGQPCEYSCKEGSRCLNGTCYALQPLGSSCVVIGDRTTCGDNDASCTCGKCKSETDYIKSMCPGITGEITSIFDACPLGGFAEDNMELEVLFRMNASCTSMWANFACCVACGIDSTYIDLAKPYLDFYSKVILSQVDLSCGPPRLVGRRACGAPAPSLATICAPFKAAGGGNGGNGNGGSTGQNTGRSHSVGMAFLLVILAYFL